jgi:SHS2 domain-containing protein
MNDSTHEELDHTADWALRVRAPDMPALLRQAALGMIEMMGVEAGLREAIPRLLEAAGEDGESLLVAWLEEVLEAMRVEPISFADFTVRLQPGHRLQAEGVAQPRKSQSKEIKAVTFHNLRIRKSSQGGLETTIVFDV